jgi:CAP-Gly domain-containing linker protein 1
MLPPPSPARSVRSVSVLSDVSRGVAEDVGDVLFGRRNSQDIPSLMEAMSPASPAPRARDIELEELHMKVRNLESQNKDLRESLLAVKVDDNSETVEKLERELEASTKKLSEIEDKLRGNERTLIERQTKVDGLDRAVVDAQEETKRAKAEGESRVKGVQAKLDESEALVTSLKKVIEDKSEAADENNAQLQAKNAEIEVLQGQVTRLSADLEGERKELTSQVDDLRQAGQVRMLECTIPLCSRWIKETIALYEERISEYEAQRYDMEALIATLEEQLKNSAKLPSPGELAKQASEAVQIDNETLREQVAHLNGRIHYLQEQIEEQQAATEKEEAAVRARIIRYKERDAQQKKELDDARVELDNVAKSEAAARTRIEELEEALRENAGTLENHRAEIETMRAELAVRRSFLLRSSRR